MAILKGSLGFKGEHGDSAYELAVKNGYEGTEEEWIEHFGLDLSTYIKGSDVVDNLTSTYTTRPLSANQGKQLDTAKQDKLVSGTNIKTINNNTLLGSGNINLPTTSEVGDVTDLETTAEDVVGAINELDGDIGDLNFLNTTAKDSVVNAINEIQTEVDNSGWVNLTSEKGSWSSLRYRKIGKIVTIEGYASSYTWSGNSEIFASIPEGIRPSVIKYIYGYSVSKTMSRLYVAPGCAIGIDWMIGITNGANYTGDTWLSFSVTYMLD